VIWDVAIVGGGPAGLAAALEARRVGCSVVVLERQAVPVDKACGEGLMPSGLAALERLGVRQKIPASECSAFEAIRYVQEDGRCVEGRLPAPGGLGIRRVALARAMAERAREAGVELLEGTALRSHSIDADGVTLQTDARELRAQLLVAADGLHSPLRKAEALEVPHHGALRFGLRQHFAIAPWAPRVEVHFVDGAEAYVTPAGAQRIGIAFLWEDGAITGKVAFPDLLARFPALAEKVAGTAADSEPRGAGPLRHDVPRRVKDRFVLLGDAAGYVDAITGEGLSLGFAGAAALAAVLPQALAAKATAASLQPYERAVAAAFDDYARLASRLVWVARRPWLRRLVINRLIAHPSWFERGLQSASRPTKS
jgi:flavin-dependent dehydrogenase